MFLIIEGFLYFLILISQLSWIKYFSIVVGFFDCLYKQRGYHMFFLILLADYILLWGDYYKLGIALFMLVQCLYHRQLANDYLFYLGLLSFLYPNIYLLAFVYALMSLVNIITAIKNHHFLRVTLILLALCDICVGLQFILQINIPLIWLFYLPSQVYYAKMVPSSEDRTTV